MQSDQGRRGSQSTVRSVSNFADLSTDRCGPSESVSRDMSRTAPTVRDFRAPAAN